MASFVIHHIAGSQFLKDLEQNYGIILTEHQKNSFLLGNLIADSTRLKKTDSSNLNEKEKISLEQDFQRLIQEEKMQTHFRNKDDNNLCIQIPNLSSFLEKYRSLVEIDFSALGYFYHLFTDKMFFSDLFSSTFDSLDKDLNHTDYLNKVAFILIKKSGKIEKQEAFWNYDSKVSIYHDYTLMNHLLLEYYKVSFDDIRLLECAKSFHNPGIVEVDYENIYSIIGKTKDWIKDSYLVDGNLHVFSENQVKDFIRIVSKIFIEKYYYLFEKLVKQEDLEKVKK